MEHNEYPWYFEQLGMLDAWELSRGSGVVIDMVDSCVDFEAEPLKAKSYAPNYKKCVTNNAGIKAVHGTAIACLMVCDPATLVQKDYDNNHLNVVGISPESLIRNVEGKINEKNTKIAIDQAKQAYEYGESPYKSSKDRERADLILLNLSGCQVTPDTQVRGDWRKLVSDICMQQDNVLFFASAGNSRIELTDSNIEKHCLPSSVNPPVCKRNSFDPIISVGATNIYNINEDPQKLPGLYEGLSTGSNYGPKYVDILAPGQSIAVMANNNRAMLASGTSEAAAIVTATAALLRHCSPYATSQKIKEVILSNSDHYRHLESKVSNGTVLNIEKIIRSVCLDDKLHVKSVATKAGYKDKIDL